MIESTTELPEFTQEDYAEFFEEPVVATTGQKAWYYGTGVIPKNHPLVADIPFEECGGCASDEVVVVAAQRFRHPFSKELFWEYEIACTHCGMYTQRSNYTEESNAH